MFLVYFLIRARINCFLKLNPILRALLRRARFKYNVLTIGCLAIIPCFFTLYPSLVHYNTWTRLINVGFEINMHFFVSSSRFIDQIHEIRMTCGLNSLYEHFKIESSCFLSLQVINSHCLSRYHTSETDLFWCMVTIYSLMYGIEKLGSFRRIMAMPRTTNVITSDKHSNANKNLGFFLQCNGDSELV